VSTIRDRIKELRRVKASDLVLNPQNWRKHTTAQASALRAVLTEIGYADALLARETEAGLELVDGHLRKSLDPDQVVPVLILDVTEDEAKKILLTHDPITGMAQADRDQLKSLLDDVSAEELALKDLLEGLARQHQLYATDGDDPNAHWQNMPGFTQEDQRPFQSIHMHFRSRADVEKFAKLIDQKITDRTIYLWFPRIQIEVARNKRYTTVSQ